MDTDTMDKETLEKLVQVLREELGDALNANMLATWIEQRFLGKPIVLPTSFD